MNLPKFFDFLLNFLPQKKHFYSVYAGLNDKDEKTQLKNVSEYVEDFSDILREYRIAFTITNALGGYYHDDGSFVRENTLIVHIYADKKDLENVIKAIAKHFNQETVMYIKHTHDVFFYQNS